MTPRLNEFPLLDPTQDILIPGQYPFTEQWGVLSLASLVATLTTGGGSGGNGTLYHDQLKNLDTPNQHPIKAISGLQAALDKRLAASEFNIFLTTYNSHVASDAHLTAEQKSILSRFSINADGHLKIEGNAYTSGWLSQLGMAGGGSGDSSGGEGTMYHDKLLNLDYPDQHPIAAVIGLQAALDSKLEISAISSWALQPLKPSYAFSELTDKPTTLSGYGITDAMTTKDITTALAGKASTSELNNFLPLTGGIINGELGIIGNPQYRDGGKTIIGRDDLGAWVNSINNEGKTTAQLRLRNDGRITFWKPEFGDNFCDIWHAGNSNLASIDWTAHTLRCENLIIGGHTITWDSAANALKIDGNIYTTGTVTQLG